ncbi:lysosomal acid lipase-related [Holotrichia oblita]|uniref:Lysosomal acid lipase-related n=1 Tax=Holotrichia oblita TaxID=644536 RepID=A0ACB9SWG0_HOLOL|nr:lysosomal acid lipase-related [Holotrichia oblita]
MAGYPLETYKLTSTDGYILTVFRLPNVNYSHSNGYSVFIQHGILSNGANFVTLGNVSLVYLLWDAGYDVWIGNFRGTYYSQDHVNLTVYDKEYWDHSIDEMATIDMPLTMDFISKTTGKRGNIYYIGHSLGTTIGLMYAAEYPEESAQYVRMFVFMAPAYTLSNMISPYKQIVPFVPLVWKIATDFDLYRLLGQSQPLRAIAQIFCLESPVLIQLCAQLHNLFYGPTTGVGSEKVPVYYNIVPGGTALKVLAQAADLVANHFRKFDYGVKNFEKYGTLKPPPYDITKIKAPCYIMYGMNDWDAINLYNTLSPEARYGIREINDGDFNHLDFVYGRHAKQFVYDRIINLFDTFPNKT